MWVPPASSQVLPASSHVFPDPIQALPAAFQETFSDIENFQSDFISFFWLVNGLEYSLRTVDLPRKREKTNQSTNTLT